MVTATVAAVILALAAFAAGRSSQAGAASPTVYDAGLPDSAPMSFAAQTATLGYGLPLRNLSLSPTGDFTVYAAQQGDSAVLWYRSLRDATTRVISGTSGGTVPRISPDGERVAYFAHGAVRVVPVAGGTPRKLLDLQALASLTWLAPDTLLATYLDGSAAAWLDPDVGQIRAQPIARCPFHEWSVELQLAVCNHNGSPYLVDIIAGTRRPILTTAPDGTPGRPLRGTAARLVGGRFLVYISPDGDLRAAAFDPESYQVGRAVSLVGGVRREGVGEAQYDLAPDGTLVFAPGVDATIGHLVRLRRGGVPERLPMPAASIQRFDLNPGGRWLAATVLGAEGQELRIYDLRDGQQRTWLTGDLIRHALWSPDGEAIAASVREGTRWAVVLGAPDGAAGPDTLVAGDSTRTMLDPTDYSSAHDLTIADWDSFRLYRADPQARPVQLDRVRVDGPRFASVSPTGKLLLYQGTEGNVMKVVVTSYPVPGRRWQLASSGVEPIWLSAGEVLYRSGVSWFLVRINPATGEPLGAPELWGRDPRFSDTSGWSNRSSHDGGILYFQGPVETGTPYLRVMPGWVGRMRAAVKGAGR